MANQQGMSNSANKKHDVFLSFRGVDTRVGFTSHLNDALIQKSIETYMDYQLNRGDDVWPALAKAIEESHVSIVVFSENYASSQWCLDELVKILECRKANGQVVIPVFYNTDPSNVKKQTGSYENVFAKHERDLGGDKDSKSNKQKVQNWRDALTEAGNICGWHSRTHRDEANLIEKVVNDVLEKLQLRYPNELESPVGTERNCRDVESLMEKDRVIGIWGMGGMGKTTIAKVLFAKFFAHYDYVCFANAREYSPNKLLSELLKEEISPTKVVGSTLHMKRLRSKKVFIVLDNVDSLDQFEYLCRDYNDLSPDSRLIITTRDRQLLSERVHSIYEVKQWQDPESLKLFSLEAFKQSHPQEGYKDLSQTAVTYAGGVPLALKVLGSNLRSKGTDFWKSTIRKLSKYPKEEIQKVLKVSYDELDLPQRNIFLDIAFFFKGENKDLVIRILDACGFEASSGIEVLEDKALITISKSNTIQMHDLLKIMGCGIDGTTHTRLSESEAVKVIKENKDTSSIEGITLDLSQNNDLPLCADTFTKMKALRILKFYIPSGQSYRTTYSNLPTVLKPFSNELRYFEWIGYPFDSLPQPFCAKLLVEIRMPHSNVKRLWQGIQELDKLEGIDLSECRSFEELPDLSKASKLKWVNLSNCDSLLDLHPSVLCAETLVTLILDGCTKLTRVKGEEHLKFLEKISVNGCISLEEFAVSWDLIENLDLSSTSIQTLDLSIGHLHNLKRLNLDGSRLEHLPKELSSLTSMKELKISGSGLKVEKQQLHDLFGGLQSLQILYLKDCRNLSELPNNISVLSQLQELRLDGSNVNGLPKSIKHLQELEILSLENCRELQCLPELPPLIKQLFAINCTSLVSVSNLKTLATKMVGKDKYISFMNSSKLDGHSLERMMESLHLTMISAAFQNVLVRRSSVAVYRYNYTSVDVCLPGSKVPRQFQYRTTESSITIELPNRSYFLGFTYSVVLSPAGGMKKDGTSTRIKCQCLLEKEGIKTTWLHTDVAKVNSDHVYVWYDPFHCDSILKFYQPKVCFEFCVANDMGEVDGSSIHIKECGVQLINVEELQSVLPELDLDSDKKQDLIKAVELESGCNITLTSIETSDGKEINDIGNHMQNQERDSSEKRSNNSIDVTEPKSAMVEPESVEEDNSSKDHFSNVEKRIEYTRKETKPNAGPGREGNITNFTEAGKRKGNTGTPTERDARLKEPIESKPDPENVSKHKSITEPKATMVEPELVEEDNRNKDHFSNVEKRIGSTHKETKPNARPGREENITNFTEAVKKKGDMGTLIERDARLKEPIESQAPNTQNASKHKSITKSRSLMVKRESAEEDDRRKVYFSDVEESKRYISKKTDTSAGRGHKENTTESTKSVKNKGTEGRPTESDAGLHPLVMLVDEENASTDRSSKNNYDWQDNIEETKHSEENPYLQGGQVLVTDTNDSILKEPYQEKENEQMGHGKREGEDGSDEDLLAELESILLGSPKSSAKATCSTSDVAIREALHNLKCLLENSLESILGDVKLQRQLHESLACIKQVSHEKVSPNVAKLVESMTSSIEDLYRDFALTQKEVEDHISRLQKKERLMQRLGDAKKRKESVKKEKSQCEDETERLEEEAKKLDEKIRILVEQKKSVELEKTKLKEAMERCDSENKKLDDEAKNMITESKELMSAIKNSESSYVAALSKQQRLNGKWEGFRTALADNCGSSCLRKVGSNDKAKLL